MEKLYINDNSPSLIEINKASFVLTQTKLFIDKSEKIRSDLKISLINLILSLEFNLKTSVDKYLIARNINLYSDKFKKLIKDNFINE